MENVRRRPECHGGAEMRRTQMGEGREVSVNRKCGASAEPVFLPEFCGLNKINRRFATFCARGWKAIAKQERSEGPPGEAALPERGRSHSSRKPGGL